MPSIADYLHDFARSASGNAPQLETELREIETRKREIETKLKAAHLALDRASRFIPRSSLDIYCPRCWITHERQSTLRPIPSENPRVDLFRCNDCNYTYEVDF